MSIFTEILYLLGFISEVYLARNQEKNLLKVNKALEQKKNGGWRHEQER